jgi:hypothetical protein
MSIGYPLSAFLDAIRTILGWTVVVFVTLVVGHWLGVCLGYGRICGLGESLNVLVWFLFAWLVYPQVAVAWGVTAVSWVLPIHLEGGRVRICAAAANFLAWIVATVWVMRG